MNNDGLQHESYLIYSWAGMGNLGDDWILTTVTQLLRNQGRDFTLLLEPQADIGHMEYLHDVNVVRWPRVKQGPVKWFNFRADANKFTTLLLASGGAIAADRGLREPINWLLRFALISIPIKAVNIGFGEFKRTFGAEFLRRQLARRLSAAGPISVRTLADGAELSMAGISDFLVHGDITLANRTPIEVNARRRKCVISLPPPNRRWMREGGEEFASRLSSFVLQRFSQHEIIFVDFQTGTGADSQFWRKYFPNVFSEPNLPAALEVFAEADFAVVGRLHAAIAAYHNQVPNVMTLGYHHKFDLLQDLGVQVRAWDDDFQFHDRKPGSGHDLAEAVSTNFLSASSNEQGV